MSPVAPCPAPTSGRLPSRRSRAEIVPPSGAHLRRAEAPRVDAPYRSRPSFMERHAQGLAASVTALGHVLLVALLIWTSTPRAVAPVLLPAERTQLILLPPRAPDVPLEDIVAPVPSTAASVRRQQPEPPRPLPKTPPRAIANWVIPPPTPPQPSLDASAPQQQEASVAAAPPSPPLPAGPSEATPGRDSWEGRVMARLERFRRYPNAARARRQEGVAQLRVSVARDGNLLALSLAQSSGFALLDQAALDTFRRAAPLPKVPDDRPAPVELLFPVEFFMR